MTRQTINTGTGANSNDGDPLRTAFTKINSNFEELYTLVGSGSGNVIDVVGPLFDHADHNNITVTLDSVNDRIILDAQFSEIIQDLKGSVIADDSSIMVDSVDNKIYASGGFYGDLKGTVVGDDSTVIVDGTGSYVNLDGTVKGNIIPDQDVAYDIGSPTNKFKDIYLSGNTMYLGSAVLQATQAGGLSLPQGSTIPGLTEVQYKPELVIDDRQQGQQYYATGAPASATIIDQATWIWSDPAKRYPTFQPSVYAAIIDGNGNITNVTLNTANYYTDTSEQWEIINTDNLIALDAGINITDPAAIRASSYFEVLPAVVQSVGDTVLASGAAPAVSGSIDVTHITNSSGVLNINGDVDFGNSGDIDFTGASVTGFAPGAIYANSGQYLYVVGEYAGGSATNVAFIYDTNINNVRQTFYGKTEFGNNGQAAIVDFTGASVTGLNTGLKVDSLFTVEENYSATPTTKFFEIETGSGNNRLLRTGVNMSAFAQEFGPEIDLTSYRSSPANGDAGPGLVFRASTGASVNDVIATIKTEVIDTTNGAVNSKLSFTTETNGSSVTPLTIYGDTLTSRSIVDMYGADEVAISNPSGGVKLYGAVEFNNGTTTFVAANSVDFLCDVDLNGEVKFAKTTTTGDDDNPSLTLIDVNSSSVQVLTSNSTTTNNWELPDGSEGQIMHFVAGGTGSGANHKIKINNWWKRDADTGGWSSVTEYWDVFAIYGFAGRADTGMATAIFVDGAWRTSSPWVD